MMKRAEGDTGSDRLVFAAVQSGQQSELRIWKKSMDTCNATATIITHMNTAQIQPQAPEPTQTGDGRFQTGHLSQR
jgi:hypothetical protein